MMKQKLKNDLTISVSSNQDVFASTLSTTRATPAQRFSGNLTVVNLSKSLYSYKSQSNINRK